MNIRRIFIRILIGILSIMLALIVTILALWGNELRALASIERICERDDKAHKGDAYSMHMPGKYYLDDFVAQGGVSSDDELIAFVTSKITKGLIPLEIDVKEMGCSSFTAQTQDGSRLFGRNYDINRTNVCIVTTDGSRDRHATISTVVLQFIGIPYKQNADHISSKLLFLAAPYVPVDGMNDAGVSCGIYVSYQGKLRSVATDQNTEKPDLTSTTLLRLILDYADSVDEAVEIAQSYDMHDSAGSSYHYMVADASGRSAILEWVGTTDETDTDGSKRELVVYYNDADAELGAVEAQSDFQCVTNFIVKPGYYDLTKPSDRADDGRYDSLYSTLGGTNGIVAHEHAGMDILRSVSRRTLKPGIFDSITAHSVIYNMTDKTALFIPFEHYGDEGSVFHFAFD